jgi:hypothetical protein
LLFGLTVTVTAAGPEASSVAAFTLTLHAHTRRQYTVR